MKKERHQRRQMLLLEDIVNLGRKGDLVSPKPGFMRNYLLPRGKGVIADKQALRRQVRLQEERRKQAAIDRQTAEGLRDQLESETFTLTVKTDLLGQLYGSVSTVDIAKLLLEEKKIVVQRKEILLGQSIKKVGSYTITLKLKEGVVASLSLTVNSTIELQEPEPSFVQEMEEEAEGEDLEEDPGSS